MIDRGISLPSGPWVAIFANPASGAGRHRRRIARLAATLEKSGLGVVTSWSPAEEMDWLGDAAALRDCRAVIAAAGDGTANRVLNARPAAPLALYPAGTENLLAREFGFDRDPAALVARIRTGRARPIDLGVAARRRFALMVTAGFDADVAHRLARWRGARPVPRSIRHYHYIRPVLAALLRYSYPPILLEWESGAATGALAMVFNVPSYARRLRPVRGARVADGLLDWMLLESPGRCALLGFARDLILGRHLQRRDVRHGQARALRLSSPQSAPLQLDGEDAGSTPVDIEIERRAVRILVT